MSDQRADTRLRLVDTTVSVTDLESGVEFIGEGDDLSGSGLRFCSELEPPVGADMEVTLRGAHPSTPTLQARLQVLRVTKAQNGNGFEIAGRIVSAR